LIALATFAALITAIRRLLPWASWYDALIVALVVTLVVVGWFISYNLGPTDTTKRSKAARLAKLMKEGRLVRERNGNLHNAAEAQEWIAEVSEWIDQASKGIAQCSPQALEKFLDDTSQVAGWSGAAFPRTEQTMRTLQQRLANLGKIVESSATYL
jgi:hypothetical protein